MSFKVVFTDPNMSEPRDLGIIDKDEFLDFFSKVPLCDLVNQVHQNPDEYYFSPSLSIENTTNGHIVEASIVTETE